MFCFISNFPSKCGPIVLRERVTEYLHLIPAVETRNALHQMGGGVVAEV